MKIPQTNAVLRSNKCIEHAQEAKIPIPILKRDQTIAGAPEADLKWGGHGLSEVSWAPKGPLYKNYPTLDGPATQTNNRGFLYEK